MHLTKQQIASAAAMAIECAVAADAGDSVKMIAFIIDEFAIVLGGNIHNVEQLAAIIDEAVKGLKARGDA